jgi:Methyltransferase domain
MLVHQVRKLLLPLHCKARQRKLDLFFQTLRPAASDTLLDVGGGAGMDGEFGCLYSFFENATTLNLAPCAARKVKHFVLGDACEMPFADKSHDWVFSNAVIEHVGNRARQQKMAAEILRVARQGYFVATPNRGFPIDPHSYLPFYHRLSCGWRERLAAVALGKYVPFEPYWMLSGQDMKQLFPGSRLVRMCAGSCLVAWRRFDPPGSAPA